jgi:hypothetical protein
MVIISLLLFINSPFSDIHPYSNFLYNIPFILRVSSLEELEEFIILERHTEH